MLIKESTLRVTGYIIITAISFIFFSLEMYSLWSETLLFPKVLLITILHTILIWEPTRFCVLSLRRRHAGLNNVRKRLVYAVSILMPYAFLVGFGRVLFEEIIGIRQMPMINIISYSNAFGISILFILLELAAYECIYFFDQWSKSLAEAEALKRINYQAQLDSLKVQIQPHFLFNTLNTIIGLIEADSDKAIKFTENLAFIYRYLLEANDRVLISLSEELQFAAVYFSVLKTRYPDGLFLQQPIADTENYEVPPLSLHILIENAVKHNYFSKVKPLNIEIAFLEQEESLSVVNNIQLKTEPKGSGKGLTYLRKQFEILKLPDINIKKYKDHFSVTIPLVNKCHYERINY
jgi:hypothetical protein